MANWKHSIDIRKEWQACKDRTLQVWELANMLSARLKRIHKKDASISDYDWELGGIIDELDFFAEEQSINTVFFNGIMNRVYDWADTTLSNRWPRWPPDKMCWIRVM